MKKLFLLMFISTVCVVLMSGAVFAKGESKVTLTGSIQSYDCVFIKEVCPIGMEDAMAGVANALVLLVDPITADYYTMPNVDKSVLARHINEQVKVVGYVDKKHYSIWTEEIYVGTKMVWSTQMQADLRIKKIMGHTK
jgi:hypothetical protein